MFIICICRRYLRSQMVPGQSIPKQRKRFFGSIGELEEIAETGKTCIDCHKGIAHHLPKME